MEEVGSIRIWYDAAVGISARPGQPLTSIDFGSKLVQIGARFPFGTRVVPKRGPAGTNFRAKALGQLKPLLSRIANRWILLQAHDENPPQDRRPLDLYLGGGQK